MKSKFIRRLVYLTLFISVLVFLAFNKYGILEYIELADEVEELNGKIRTAESKIKSLQAEIDSLKHNQFKIEKIAREKYHMLDKKERAIKIEEK
ncbi:septum formation initiator family protein [Bacteroidota bacterium]